MPLKAIRFTIAALIFATCAGAQTAAGLEFGAGWSPPSETDIAGPDARFRVSDRERYLEAAGDFDGDGRSDRALLLVNRDRSTYGLFAFLAGRAEPVLVFERPLASLGRVGIDTVRPGVRRTACGRGHGPDSAPCEPSVNIPHDGISFFTFESASGVAFWNGDGFRVVFTSD